MRRRRGADLQTYMYMSRFLFLLKTALMNVWSCGGKLSLQHPPCYLYQQVDCDIYLSTVLDNIVQISVL